MNTSLALAFSLLVIAACDQKEPAPKPDPSAKRAAVDRALGTANEGPVMAGKGTMVNQQCAMMCQAKPGIDPGECTSRCTKACADEKDVSSIDACARRVAAETPGL